jgi:hypothetical protein
MCQGFDTSDIDALWRHLFSRNTFNLNLKLWPLFAVTLPSKLCCLLTTLVSESIWWHVGHDYARWFCPPWNMKCPYILKNVEIPTPKLYYTLALNERGSTVLPLLVCLSFCNKFSSEFLQQLLFAGTCNFSTLFDLACHMAWFIFLQFRKQLSVYPCVCLNTCI